MVILKNRRTPITTPSSSHSNSGPQQTTKISVKNETIPTTSIQASPAVTPNVLGSQNNPISDGGSSTSCDDSATQLTHTIQLPQTFTPTSHQSQPHPLVSSAGTMFKVMQLATPVPISSVPINQPVTAASTLTLTAGPSTVMTT